MTKTKVTPPQDEVWQLDATDQVLKILLKGKMTTRHNKTQYNKDTDDKDKSHPPQDEVWQLDATDHVLNKTLKKKNHNKTYSGGQS